MEKIRQTHSPRASREQIEKDWESETKKEEAIVSDCDSGSILFG